MNLIGGTVDGSGNRIAFNGGAGVLVASGAGNTILGNSISANLADGIVVLPGANANQPAPRLTQIVRVGRSIRLMGVVRGIPSTTYRVEFFANPTRRTAVAGGVSFLGSALVTTDRRGIARARFVTPSRVAARSTIATATSQAGDTSPFSDSLPLPLATPSKHHH